MAVYNYKISIRCIPCSRIQDMFVDLEVGKTATIQCKDCLSWKCNWVVSDKADIWFREDGVFNVFIR